jgi:triosephosphate isomerase
MRKLFIVANWKTYPLNQLPQRWIEEAGLQKEAILKANNEKVRETVLIVCPSYSMLWEVRKAIDEVEGAKDFVHLGTQDISAYSPGAHTGDEAVETLKSSFGISYAIIGHSERRREHAENYQLLKQKVEIALQNSITPIFCVQTVYEEVPEGVEIVAYEPPSAISAVSGGIPANPRDVELVGREIRKRFEARGQKISLLYGGSINAENVWEFTRNNELQTNFDGVLVGAKSLTPEFFQIAINV